MLYRKSNMLFLKRLFYIYIKATLVKTVIHTYTYIYISILLIIIIITILSYILP